MLKDQVSIYVGFVNKYIKQEKEKYQKIRRIRRSLKMPKKFKKGGPQDFAEYITPEKAFEQDKELNNSPAHTLKEYERAARSRRRCIVCGAPVWRLVMTDMCFSCTTGESDASEDYELIQL
jgi:hypothetical protein